MRRLLAIGLLGIALPLYAQQKLEPIPEPPPPPPGMALNPVLEPQVTIGARGAYKGDLQMIHACTKAGYSDVSNLAVCTKRCQTGGEHCVKESFEVINSCRALFTDQSNSNYCKDHCAQAPLESLDQCRRHAAEMINSGRREQRFQ